jgi:FkbM family methyltransferase
MPNPQRFLPEDALDEVKERFVATPLGRLALTLRDAVKLLRVSWSHPEAVGTLSNDQLATRLVTRLVSPGKIFVDVGAHIGSVVASVLQRDPSVRIVAIEPIPERAASLRRRFPAIEVHQCAAGEADREATFFINTKESGYSSLLRPGQGGEKEILEIKTTIRRLDDLLPGEEVDTIKIDVEGAELDVLRGAPRLLKAARPVIMFESAPDRGDERGPGPDKEALWDLLTAAGYSLLIPVRVAHDGPGLTREGFIESHLYPRRTTNYFAIPDERRLEVRDAARRIMKVMLASI